MPTFPQLDIEWSICYEYKITKTVPSPGGASKMKNSKTVGRNQVQTSTNMQNIKPESDNKISLSKK